MDGALSIGGNKIALTSRDDGILLDFGVNMRRKRDYLLGYRALVIANKLYYYLYSEILPKIRGIYREDLVELDERAKTALEKADELRASTCIISHGHADHYGAAGFLSNNIAIAMSNSMKTIIESMIESSAALDIEVEIFQQKDRRRGEKLKRRFKGFEEETRIPDISFSVIPYPVDHSLPAAFGFLIEEASLAYTGDIRMHGLFKHLTKRFIEKVQGVEYLMIEGTRISSSIRVSEEEVSREIERFIEEKPGKLISIIVSPTDIDRLRDIFRISERLERKLVISPKIAYLIDKLASSETKITLPSMKNVFIYFERRSLKGDGYDLKSAHYRSWLKNVYLNRIDGKMEGELIKPDQISKDQGSYIFMMSGLDYILELAQIRPEPGSRVIVSTSEPHDEEQEIEWSRFERWIDLLRLDLRHVHSSGHADRESLLEIINGVNPKKLIPIHTVDHQEFERLRKAGDIRCDVIFPKIGEAIKL